MLPSVSSTLPESSRKPVGFLMLSGGIKVNREQQCVTNQTHINHAVYTSLPLSVTNSVFIVIAFIYLLSGSFHPNWWSFYWFHLFLNKKTDFQVIKFLNLNFRFPLGSVSKCKIYDLWIFICYFMSIVHCFCMTSC